MGHIGNRGNSQQVFSHLPAAPEQELKMRSASVLLLAIFATASVAFSQEWPKVEVGVDYSYLRFAPSGPYTKGHSLNGGGGSVGYNWNEYLGIKLDLQGYTSNTTGFNILPKLAFQAMLN